MINYKRRIWVEVTILFIYGLYTTYLVPVDGENQLIKAGMSAGWEAFIKIVFDLVSFATLIFLIADIVGSIKQKRYNKTHEQETL